MNKRTMQRRMLSLAEYESLVFGALATATMGNATPTQVVAANADRRSLVVCNVSDTTGYLCLDDATGLTINVYAYKLGAGETLTFSPPLSVGALFAICGAGSKNLTYQEAT